MISTTELDRLMVRAKLILAPVHPLLRDRVQSLVRQLFFRENLCFAPFMGMRTFAEQDALYAQGRTAPGKIVTRARGGDSLHQYGLAVDLAEDGDPDNDRGIQWSWKKNADYLKIGEYAGECGLEWGGNWKAIVDIPHVQITGGLTLGQIKALYSGAAPGQELTAVWAHVSDLLLTGGSNVVS